jgi:hypothetical protein
MGTGDGVDVDSESDATPWLPCPLCGTTPMVGTVDARSAAWCACHGGSVDLSGPAKWAAGPRELWNKTVLMRKAQGRLP